MSVTTSSRDQLPWVATRGQALLVLAYSTGAAALAGESAVHVQQYVRLVGEVPWIGPLFLANAAVGWHEAGFRTAVAVGVITAVVATIALTLALAVAATRPRETR
jgi:hypothetical protein